MLGVVFVITDLPEILVERCFSGFAGTHDKAPAANRPRTGGTKTGSLARSLCANDDLLTRENVGNVLVVSSQRGVNLRRRATAKIILPPSQFPQETPGRFFAAPLSRHGVPRARRRGPYSTVLRPKG